MPGVHPIGEIEQHNFLLRGKIVVLDSDLARLFGIETRRLNEQLKRAAYRFPADFRFQMTAQELETHVASCGHRSQRNIAGCDVNLNRKLTPHLPFVYTEQGALMAAIVLRSRQAIYTCVGIVYTLVSLRRAQRLQAALQEYAGTTAS
jgi:hypothetical protein